MFIEFGSANFEEFLEVLGEKIRLKGWERFRGGLDVKGMYFLSEINFKRSFFMLFRRGQPIRPQKLHHSLSSLNFHIVHLNHTHFFILCTNSVGLVVSFYL